jgi:endonuclease/exonuclease/phosphatase family metal-dependent hydrolase
MNISTLRVMTFNIRHGRGMDDCVSLQNIAAEIKRSGADIIGIQEVDRFLPRSDLQDQPAELARLLNMHVCYCASEDRHNTSNTSAYIRDKDEKTGLDGQYGNAILSRFPISAQQHRYLPGNHERRSWLQAEIDINGNIVNFLCTHLGFDDEEHSGQVDDLINAVKSTFGAIVLVGDFNMMPENPLLKQLSSVIRKVPLRDNVTTFAGNKDVIMEIDHIFTNLPLDKEAAWTQITDASDHHALIAQIQLS